MSNTQAQSASVHATISAWRCSEERRKRWGSDMDTHVSGEILAFDGWRFDLRTRVLLRQGGTKGHPTPVPVGARALEILALLLQHPGAPVSKAAIMEAVWPDVAVEPNNLKVQVAALRRVLDAHRTGGRCIQT